MTYVLYHLHDPVSGMRISGGTVTGDNLSDAVSNIPRLYDMRVLPSGRVSYRSDGIPVNISVPLDPADTDTGRVLIRSHLKRLYLDLLQHLERLYSLRPLEESDRAVR